MLSFLYCRQFIFGESFKIIPFKLLGESIHPFLQKKCFELLFTYDQSTTESLVDLFTHDQSTTESTHDQSTTEILG